MQLTLRGVWRNYQTRFEAQQDILNYITMHYNSKHLHSFLGYKAPNKCEMDYLMQFKKSRLTRVYQIG